mgnify:CR=1 FL=1
MIVIHLAYQYMNFTYDLHKFLQLEDPIILIFYIVESLQSDRQSLVLWTDSGRSATFQKTKTVQTDRSDSIYIGGH